MLHESSRYGIQGTGELDVLSTLTIEDNGLVLQGVMEEGRVKARPSNATAGSQFLGMSFGIVGRGVPKVIPAAEILHTSVANNGFATVQLTNPLAAAGNLLLVVGTSYGGQVLSPTASPTTAPADATHYQLAADGRSITVTAALADSDLFAVYRFSPTVESARWTYGDYIPGNRSPQNFGRIGSVYNGLLYTDMFDISVDWSTVSAASVLKGGANGLITTVGDGCIIDGKLVSVPIPDLPFLGIALSDAVGP